MIKVHIEILLPSPGKLRARKIVGRSSTHLDGKEPGFKSGRMHYGDSISECDFIALADADPQIVGFEEQPATLKFTLNGIEYRHYPDFLVRKIKTKIYVEVKKTIKDVTPFIQMRTDFLKTFLPYYGFEYKLVIASNFDSTHLSNSKEILRMGSQIQLSEITLLKLQTLAKHTSIFWGALDETGKRTVCHAVLKGVLFIDRKFPIQESTVFTVTDPNKGDKPWL